MDSNGSQRTVALSAHERKAALRRIDELKEQLQTLLDQRMPRQQLVENSRTVLDEISDLNEKLGDE